MQGTARITYSFFSSALGAWCITGPSQYAVYVGIVGLASYSVSAGLPVLLLALSGAWIQVRWP